MSQQSQGCLGHTIIPFRAPTWMGTPSHSHLNTLSQQCSISLTQPKCHNTTALETWPLFIHHFLGLVPILCNIFCLHKNKREGNGAAEIYSTLYSRNFMEFRAFLPHKPPFCNSIVQWKHNKTINQLGKSQKKTTAE